MNNQIMELYRWNMESPMADAKTSRLERRAQKKDRQAIIKEQRESFRKRERNKRIFNYSLLTIIAVAVAYGLFVLLSPEETGKHDPLAQCLTAQGVAMYGTDWCSHCQDQKRLFGRSFKHVTYVNCDLDTTACNLAGIEGFPTWVFPDGTKKPGVQSLESLAARFDCPLG
jgi:hypothetical protein